MSVAAERVPDWSQWEGERVDGEFLLKRYLGGSDRSAVFLTGFGSERAAIKLVRASRAQAEDLLEGWNGAAALVHPHLLQIFKTGTCVLNHLPLAYLVMEYADEDLGTVLAERVLTSDEAAEMIRPVADVLAYLHAAGLAHGNLKPSNIFAVQDTVKISCDTVSAGDPAVDVLALSKTMIQALTNRDPTSVEKLPQPFREIAQNCLFAEPQRRWSSAELADWLRSGQHTTAVGSVPDARVSMNLTRKGWFGFFAVCALILLAIGVGALVMWRKAAPTELTPARQVVAPVVRSVPAEAASAERGGVNAASSPAPVAAPDPWTQQGIVHHVLPDIPAKARRTVRGKATVAVRVGVDSSGNVIDARLERGGSRYFGKLTLASARLWKFAPTDGAGLREWILRFEITKKAVNVVPEEQTVTK